MDKEAQIKEYHRSARIWNTKKLISASVYLELEQAPDGRGGRRYVSYEEIG